MYASFVSRLEEASESEEEFDDASQDDNEVVRYERTSRHQSRRDELIRRVQAAHAHSAAAHARGGDSEPSHSDEQQDQRAPAAAAPTTTAQQDTLDTYLPRHAARARELEAASDSLVDDASDKGSTGSIAGNRSGRRAAAVQDEAACAATGHDPSAVRGRNKRKRLQSRSLAGLGGGRGRQSTGLDLIGAFRGGAGSLPDPQASVRHPAPSSHQIRSHSLRAAQQSAHSRGRGGGLDLVGAFRSSAAQSTQSPQPELSSQRVYKKARPGAKAPKATPSKCHSLRRADPASADRGCLWKAPPSFLGGPVRNLDSQSSGSRAFAHLQHPAEATQSRLGDKKGLKGERERVIADMKSGVFAADRLAVKLRFRMLDGHWEGDIFCPCCEVITLESPPPTNGAPIDTLQRTAEPDDEDSDSLYSDFSWAKPGKLFDLILSPIIRDLYSELNIREASDEFRQRQFEGVQPIFSQPGAGDGNRPIVVACAVTSMQSLVPWDSRFTVHQSGTQTTQQCGYGYGAPGSMYPDDSSNAETGTMDPVC